jgi:hypothetical protein
MVTVLFASFVLLAVITLGIYLFSKRTSRFDQANRVIPPSPSEYLGLFAPSADELKRLESAGFAEQLAANRESLLARASAGEKAVLSDARQSGDSILYDEVLSELVNQAANEKQILALASYVTRAEDLRVNTSLAGAFLETWRDAPDRRSTSQMLHLAALTGDATFYREAIESAVKEWQERRISDLTSEELAQLIESEFWVIPSHARSSGAGFLLKKKLANIRRVLAAQTSDE